MITNTNKNHFYLKNNWITFKNPKIERISIIKKNLTIIIPQIDSLNNKFCDMYKFEVNLLVFLVDNQILEIRVLNNSNRYYLRIK